MIFDPSSVSLPVFRRTSSGTPILPDVVETSSHDREGDIGAVHPQFLQDALRMFRHATGVASRVRVTKINRIRHMPEKQLRAVLQLHVALAGHIDEKDRYGEQRNRPERLPRGDCAEHADHILSRLQDADAFHD